MTVERILAWYRVGSSVGAVAALIVANLVPLIGVLFFGWSVWNILIVYWLENGVVGAFNVLKMATAQGTGLPDGITANNRPVAETRKTRLIPFFIVHYGLFWVVHGIFVLTLPFLFTGEPGSASGVDPATILFAAIVLGISHAVSYWWNYLHGGEYRRDQRRAVDVRPVWATDGAPHDDHPRRRRDRNDGRPVGGSCDPRHDQDRH